MTTTNRPLTMSAAMVEAVRHEMTRDPSVLFMGEDVGPLGGVFGTTTGLFGEFGPQRVIDTPISESGFIGTALGAAAAGLRPIVELMFVDFFGVAMDQIYNHLAKNTYMSDGNVTYPVVIPAAIGGGYSDAAQHSQCLYATFAHVPGLKVVVPSNAYDAKGLMTTAIRDDNPVMFLFHKGLMGLYWMNCFEGSTVHVPEESYEIPFGQASVVREGGDVTVVTISQMVHKCRVAAEQLGAEGIDVEILDLRTLVPLDREAIVKSVSKTGRLLIVDEDYLSFGLSGEVVATVAENADSFQLAAPVRRLAVPDVPLPFSRVLEDHVIPQVDDIAQAIRELAPAKLPA